jgi:septum formation protein
LVLAYASPRRARLLRTAGFQFRVEPVDVDETAEDGEGGAELAWRLAALKARACAARTRTPCLVLGSDTVVLVDGLALGKPADRREALDMLRRLNGREHQVVTAVALVRPGRPEVAGGSVRTSVRFHRWDEETLRAYADTGEGLDKAGAYAIQDGGGALIDTIAGSASNVIGLPLAQTVRWIREAGGPTPFGGSR